MCIHCQTLINAIDRYITKADDDLKDEFEESGRQSVDKTMKCLNEIENGVTAALLSETEYFVEQVKKRKTLSELIDDLEEIKLNDIYCDEIKNVVSEQLHKLVPHLVKKYVSVVDKEIKITTISKRTYDWIDSWSSDLADIMKLNSHATIEKLIKDGLDIGNDIPSVARAIQDSGIRNECYRARTTAVTEVLCAHNVAKQEAAMQNPCIKEKMWRHTGNYNNKPRENHVDMDGQKVSVSETFTLTGADGNTYNPMFPTDPALPPGERINCHCLSQDIVDEEILGLSLEERQRLQQEAIDAMDDEWEKELDAQNKAKAGIDDD